MAGQLGRKHKYKLEPLPPREHILALSIRSTAVAHRDRTVLLCRGSSIPPHQDRTGIFTGPSLSSKDVQVVRLQLVQQPSLSAIPPLRHAALYF